MKHRKKLPNGWFVVGLSVDLINGQVSNATIQDTELVIWRDHKGIAHAWYNRCPHRGTRLSLGFVRGDRLACLYHGFQFMGDGRCIYTPAMPNFVPPKSFAAIVFQCFESQGFIWVGNKDMEPGDISDLMADDSNLSSRLLPIRSLFIQRSSSSVIDRLPSIPFPPSKLLETSDGSCLRVEKDEVHGTFVWESRGRSIKASYQTNELKPGIFNVICQYEDKIDILMVTVQPINTERTAVHLILIPELKSREPNSLRLSYAKWSRIFRQRIENFKEKVQPS